MIGKLLDHRYQVIRVLATGGFGETFIAQDTKRPGNPICVVKHLKGANSDPKVFETAKRLFHSEAETLEKLGNHDQIPRLLAYFDENKEFYLVQEFIEGHTLSEELVPNQRWSESEAIQMLLEVLNILEFVHREGVIHRDIKPDNIIRRTCDHKLVLVDFGAVKQLRSPNLTFAGQTTATVAIGTPGYMPTEQGQGKPRPNSDIYSLGVIAIQALTGVAPIDFQEDPDTGEIVWQHLAPVSPELTAVLTKMVRYHFKDRYNTIMQALLSLQLLSSVPVKPQEYAKTPSSYQATKPTSQESRLQTIAVAPANPPGKPNRKESNRPDLLPLVIAALLAGGAAAIATNLVGSAKNLGFNFASNGATSANICEAVVTGNSNIRSEPSAINSDNIVQTLSNNTPFEVTGKRTKLGWVQVKLDSGKSAWANSHVIANPEQWVSCLRDKGIAIKTVNDSDLIAARPIPQPIPKPAAVTSSPKQELPESPKQEKPDPFRAEPFTSDKTDTSTSSENNSQVVEQAREKYDNGDLAGAIALLKSLPANASSTWNETTGTVTQWQQDWAKAEALSNEINKALDNGQWDKVLAYKNHPEKLPNIQYWRDKMDPLFKQAADNLAKQELPKLGKPHPQNHRQHQVETLRGNVSTEESDNIDSETTTERSESGF